MNWTKPRSIPQRKTNLQRLTFRTISTGCTRKCLAPVRNINFKAQPRPSRNTRSKTCSNPIYKLRPSLAWRSKITANHFWAELGTVQDCATYAICRFIMLKAKKNISRIPMHLSHVACKKIYRKHELSLNPLSKIPQIRCMRRFARLV